MAASTSSLIVEYCATKIQHRNVHDARTFRRLDLAQRASRLLIAGAAGGAGALIAGSDAAARRTGTSSPRGAPGPDHQAVRGHVGGDDGTGTDEGVLAQRNAADDRRVGPDRAAAFHQRAPVFVLA